MTRPCRLNPLSSGQKRRWELSTDGKTWDSTSRHIAIAALGRPASDALLLQPLGTVAKGRNGGRYRVVVVERRNGR